MLSLNIHKMTHRNARHILRSGRSLGLLSLAITMGAPFSGTVQAQLLELPEVPAFVRDTHLIENGEFTRPHQPTVHATRDGRVTLDLSGITNLKFGLFKPEKLNQPFTTSAPGVDNVFGEEEYTVSPALFQDSTLRGQRWLRHVGLCEPPASEVGFSNPRVCNGDNDCYDFTVVSAAEGPDGAGAGYTFVGTKTTVRVENPKSVDARIVEVTTEEPVVGHHHPTFRDFFELMTPADGRILVGRTGGSQIAWTDEQGTQRESTNDNVYLVNDNPDAFEACDVRQFDKVYPLANAPYDSTINNRYGFAMHPFRDSTGKVFADDKAIGSYPWIDRDADNISITTLPGKLFASDTGEPRFPARCPDEVVLTYGSCLSDSESDINSARLQGRVMMGLWTQGKMVKFDNLVNNMDFGLGTEERRHRELQLYSSSNDHNGWVRVSSGRNGSPEGGPLPRGTDNANFFGSLEHRFYMFDHLKPVSPSDVPWIVGKGMVSDELSFDDYNNPDSFIVSTMVAASRNNQYNWFEFLNRDDASAVANDATALPDRWSIPAMGTVHNGRVEMVANGGVKGRGLWLDGANGYVEYDIPFNDRDVYSTPWYVGLFFDRRYSDSSRNLISFSDGSSIRVDGSGDLQFVNTSDMVIKETSVPSAVQNRSRPNGQKGWAHVGINVTPGNQSIVVFYNGYVVDEFTVNEPLFGMNAGKLYVGAAPVASVEGFRGWIDEFKVFAQNVNPEVACNHANGTLIGIEAGTDGWENIARAYPIAGHETIGQLVQAAGESTHPYYACRHDYSGDYVLNMSNIESKYTSVREAVNFPEGPLKFNEPRPDSSNNAFCLSCHTAQGKGGLGLDALTINNNLMLQDDSRRQPTQPDAKVYGYIPANWLGFGKPANALDAGSEGVAIDQWLNSIEQEAVVSTPTEVEITEPEETTATEDSSTEVSTGVVITGEQTIDVNIQSEVETTVIENSTNEVSTGVVETGEQTSTAGIQSEVETTATENSTIEGSTDVAPIKVGTGAMDKMLLLLLSLIYIRPVVRYFKR